MHAKLRLEKLGSLMLESYLRLLNGCLLRLLHANGRVSAVPLIVALPVAMNVCKYFILRNDNSFVDFSIIKKPFLYFCRQEYDQMTLTMPDGTVVEK